MAYGKLIGGKLIEAPNILNKDGKQYINPPEELYLEYGYLPLEYTTIPNIKNGFHLVQSQDIFNNKLIQRQNYEADSELELFEQIKKLKEKINLLENSKTNPIIYYDGMEIDEGKQYSNGLLTVKAIMGGTPKSFNDINYFD